MKEYPESVCVCVCVCVVHVQMWIKQEPDLLVNFSQLMIFRCSAAVSRLVELREQNTLYILMS